VNRLTHSFHRIEGAIGEFDRHAHVYRSLKMTLMTLVLGLSLFALFFGLVAACNRL
jgi:hypothetical protein